MATVLGANATLYLADPFVMSTSPDANTVGGQVRVMHDSIELSTAAVGDIALFGRVLPTGSKIIDVIVHFDALDATAATFDIGTSTYDGTDATAVDQDQFLDGVSCIAAGGTSMSAQGTTIGTGPFSEIADGEYISLEVATVTSSLSGTVKITVIYAEPT